MTLRSAVRAVVSAQALAWVALVLGLFYLFRALGRAPSRVIDRVWLTSDTLWPVNLFTDVFIDRNSLSGWHFSVAPCWFPDLALVGLFFALTHSVILATLLAGFVQIGLLVGAFQIVRSAAGIRATAAQDVFLLGAGVALTLFVGANPDVNSGLHQFFLPQTHVGSLVTVLYALGLGLFLVRNTQESGTSPPWLLLGYVSLCVLGGMSNLLFIAQMLAPLTVSLLGALFFHMLKARACLLPVLIGWPATILGVILNRVVFRTTNLSATADVSYERIVVSMDTFVRGALRQLLDGNVLQWLAVLWAGICLSVVLGTLRAAVVNGSHCLALSVRIAAVFFSACLLSSIFSGAAIILGGSWGLSVHKDYVWSTHYMHPTFLLPLLGLPLSLAWGLHQVHEGVAQKAAWGCAVLAVIVTAYGLAATPRPRTSIARYVPPLVGFIDRLASEEGLKTGIASYWHARPLTLLSRTGLRAYAVDPELRPFLWVSNQSWYREVPQGTEKALAVDFVILDEPRIKISREMVVGRRGEPSLETRFEDTRILIYGRRAE